MAHRLAAGPAETFARIKATLLRNQGLDTESLRARLEAAGVCLHSAWTFDVPEILSGARELYRHLTWLRDEPPSFEALGPRLQAVLDRHGGAVDMRQKRFLWKAVIN